AGLHFTPEILDSIRRRGIETAEVTLHVGLGTFQPVREEVVERNILHKEWYEISEEAAEKIQRARETGRRIVAVGTTTVRTLEYAVRQKSLAEETQTEPGTLPNNSEIVISAETVTRRVEAQSRDLRFRPE